MSHIFILTSLCTIFIVICRTLEDAVIPISVRDVVVMVSSIKELILSGFVFTDRLTIIIIEDKKFIPRALNRPNIRVLSPVETTPFLMLLGDQLVLLQGKEIKFKIM